MKPEISNAVIMQTSATPDGTPRTRLLPLETPVALVLDGTSAGVLMSSPMDLQDLAVGFAISEGFITGLEDVADYEEVAQDNGIEARLWLRGKGGLALQERRRLIAGPVGCGMCGIDSLDQAMRRVPEVSASELRMPQSDISGAGAALNAVQPLHDQTYGAHAAGFLVPDHGILLAREDVGRHNALDKLIGGLLRDGIDPAQGAMVMTSRLSVELVQKCAMVGCGMIIAFAAPTAEAIRIADRAGITAIGFARHDDFEIFTHPMRVLSV